MQKENGLVEANKKAEEAFQLLQTKLVATSNRLDTSINEVKDYSSKINEISKEIVNNTDDQIELLNVKLKMYKELYNKALENQNIAIKEIKSLGEITDPNIVKSDLSDFFNNLIKNYQEFLSSLSSEQMVIVFNIIGYILLLITLTSITTVLIGDQLIKILKLETKYPKLANYIKLKQTLNKYYLRFYIVLFYILLLLLISINIFMFSLEYFL
jgi:ASC-1-like (ASCH) protein